MVMVYADREIKAGKEVQFSWGEETWQRHQQIQVGDVGIQWFRGCLCC
jgi:SET domain-containing protein